MLLRLILVLIFLVLLAELSIRLLKRVKVPSVVTLIVFGLVIGIPFVEGLLLEGHGETISVLGEAGLVTLMFLAGMESNWKLLLKEKKDAFMIAVFALVAPLVLGLIVVHLWGFGWHSAIIVGICLSISAEATRARVLMELNKMRTRLGAALIGAGIVDDTLGLSLFIVISLIFHTGFSRENILVILAIIAFFAGLYVKKCLGRRKAEVKWTERSLKFLIIPFFFISIGLRFDISSLIVNPVLLVLIVVLAFSGKFMGAFMTKPFLDFTNKQFYLIGWAMNSRGALELAIALVAFRNDLINVELYSSLVLTALITTLTFPFVLYYMIGKNEHIMDHPGKLLHE